MAELVQCPTQSHMMGGRAVRLLLLGLALALPAWPAPQHEPTGAPTPTAITSSCTLAVFTGCCKFSRMNRTMARHWSKRRRRELLLKACFSRRSTPQRTSKQSCSKQSGGWVNTLMYVASAWRLCQKRRHGSQWQRGMNTPAQQKQCARPLRRRRGVRLTPRKSGLRSASRQPGRLTQSGSAAH